MAVAIIGAGMAGLNAARLLASHGVEVELYESSARLGGRAHTHVHQGNFVELGPEFVHGEPAVLLELVREAKLELETIDEVRFRRIDDRLEVLPDPWTQLGRLVAPAANQPDCTARAFLDRIHGTRDEQWIAENFIEGYYAAPLDDISIASVALDLEESGDHPRSAGSAAATAGWSTGWSIASSVSACASISTRASMRSIGVAIAWRSTSSSVESRPRSSRIT